MDNVEMAQESLEHAHAHAHAHGHVAEAGPHAAASGTRTAAVLVAVFAAIAVILEMSANDAQTTYLARTITASDLWNEYQAKSVRRTVWLADLDGLAIDPAQAPAIAHAHAEADRLADDPANGGMKQIAADARADEHERNHALHLHEQLERAVRVLQIAIVLIGLYLATRMSALMLAGSALGLLAILWGAISAIGIV